MPTNLLAVSGEIQLGTNVVGPDLTYTWTVLDGWNPFSPPEFREMNTDYIWDMGAAPGHDTMGTRRLTIPMYVTGDGSLSTLQGYIQILQAWFGPQSTEQELGFQVGSTKYVYYGRPRGLAVTHLDAGRKQAWLEGRFEALDPRYYEEPVSTFTNSAVASGAGSTAITTQTALAVASAPSPWQLIIRPNSGTITNPALIDDSGLMFVQFNGTVASGKEVYFDTRTRTCIYRDAVTGFNAVDGLASTTLDQTWWDFPAYASGDAFMYRSAATVTSTWILTYRKAHF